MKYLESSYLPVEAAALSAVPGMWGGVDGRFYDGPPQAPHGIYPTIDWYRLLVIQTEHIP